MQSDNDYSATLDEINNMSSDDSQDKTLEWLLDQDYTDPAENLFALAEEELPQEGLSDYETEVANRPMFGGQAGADDLSGFMTEEIVLTAPGESRDIYSRDLGDADPAATPERNGSHMALDHSASKSSGPAVPARSLDEGSDILGLADEDDIGERFVVIQKSRPQPEPVAETPAVSLEPPKETVSEQPVDIVCGQSNAEFEESVERANELALDDFSPGALGGVDTLDDQASLGDQEMPAHEEITIAEEPLAYEEQPAASEAWTVSLDGAEQEKADGFDLDDLDEPVALEADDAPPADDAMFSEVSMPRAMEDIIDDGSAQDSLAYGVLDFVAANEPPADDEDFDDYLLQGEHLATGTMNVDDLEVDRTDGVASVDPCDDIAIDYHEDFRAGGSAIGTSVTAITAVIGEVMEEVSASVANRLLELGLDAGRVRAELMLGHDAESIAACIEDNYRPVLEVVSDTPEALAKLGQAEIDAIYIRLSDSLTEEHWPALFRKNIAELPVTDDSAEDTGLETEAELPPLARIESIAAADDTVTAEPEQPVFEDDIFGSDISEEFAAAESAPGTPTGLENGGFDIDDLPLAAEDNSSLDSIFDDDVFAAEADWDAAGADEAAPSSPELASAAAVSEEQDTLLAAVFEDDIFSTDLDEEFDETPGATATEVDALLESLGDDEPDIEEIYSVTSADFPAETPKTETAGADAGVEEGIVERESGQADAAQSVDVSWCVPGYIIFNYTSASVAEVFTDFLDAFIEEGASELEKLEDAIGLWEQDIRSEDAYTPIPRVLHTLKGIAKGVGLQRYGTLIHNFETLLEKLEKPSMGAEPTYFRVVNAWLDAAVRGFEHIETERVDVDSELPVGARAPVLDEPAVIGRDAGSELAITPVAAILPAAEARKQDKQLADEGAKVLAAQQTIRMTPEAIDHLLSLTNEAQQLGVRSSQSTVRSKRAAAELLARLSSVRSHVSKIADRALLNVTAKGGTATAQMDALEMDQYSELQEAANILREGVEDLDDLIHLSNRQNTIAEALLKQQASVVSSLRTAIQDARVVPVSRLMPGLRRIARTVSSDLGKAVNFRVLNEVGTLDRDNHARCQIILEHMLRNALDHGVEKPEVRTAAGKDATGTITIDASKQGSDYIITLQDDGKGIDPEAMRDAAYEKGLDVDVDMLSDAEAIRLIFHKGFSTAKTVSEISGRGVGMDIVLSELQHIGGDIEIASTVGEGTAFTVRIPSNITVNGALLVDAGEASYAIPLDGLIAVEHVPVGEFYKAIERGSRLTLFGMDCEPAYLATICHGDSLPEKESWNSTVPVIIAGSEKRYMAIAIDDVTQALELVIRSLGAQFSTIPGLAGGATTADGQSIVALDLNALVSNVADDDASTVSLRKEQEERMLVLVVDDSRTQRMVATSQFDSLGVETVTAENGLVAIDLLNVTHRLPDVVLLDIEMPVKDGIQTLREIRKSDRYGHLPVIMVTSRTGAKHRALAEAAGCNGYMGKPFNFPRLVEQIAELTEHKFELS